jgi:hypothetical protein
MAVAGKILLVCGALAAIGCQHVEKNRNDGYVPAQLECPTPTDPTCMGQAVAGVQIPIPTKGKKARSVTGRCELYIPGEKYPRPCSGIKIVARAVRENEVRDVVVDGNTFRVQDLNSDSYRIEAVSPDFELATDSPLQLTPGQNIKIRVIRTKPRL